MAGIIKGSINLSEIPKDKIIEGKKGKYLPFLPSIILSLGISDKLILPLIIPAILCVLINLVKHPS
ncbi:MAG: hypothetical protein GY787_31900 [Alteromonadales bacterium]|nr:hypothetical protein [Alteromonadales bacterium]